jgi:hypothetical protein
MDKLLADLLFAFCYIDDIVVVSDTWEEHLNHLETLLSRMKHANLALNSKKCKIAFSHIELLGHLVDRYGLATLEAKTAAIREMEFPTTLAELEHFLGLTGFYRNYVSMYAQKAAPLNQLKTALVKPIQRSDLTCAKKAASVLLPRLATLEQLESFKVLKQALSSERFLVHDNPSIPTMISVDASYEFGFGATVYQVPKDMMLMHNLTHDDLRTGNYDRRIERVIMFLSREITAAESRYWPTELETAGVVFSMQKSRHVIESNANTTIVFTDHAAVRQIAQAVSLKTASPEWANMRLIQAAQYLSQFRLDFRYRPGKDNIVPDALSRLKRIVYHVDMFNIDNDIAPEIALPDYVATMIHLSPDMLDKWASSIKTDRHLYSIYKQLLPKLADAVDAVVEDNKWILKKISGIPVLFIRKRQEGLRVCIPEGMHKDVLQIGHDN